MKSRRRKSWGRPVFPFFSLHLRVIFTKLHEATRNRLKNKERDMTQVIRLSSSLSPFDSKASSPRKQLVFSTFLSSFTLLFLSYFFHVVRHVILSVLFLRMKVHNYFFVKEYFDFDNNSYTKDLITDLVLGTEKRLKRESGTNCPGSWSLTSLPSSSSSFVFFYI